MWICVSCKNVNADDLPTCLNCGDLGPIGEEMRRKAARRPGEQFIWLLAMAAVFIWPCAALLWMAHRPDAKARDGATLNVDHNPAMTHLMEALAIGFGVVAIVYLSWIAIWIYRRSKDHKALVDIDD